MQIEGMCLERLSHKDAERDKRDGDVDEESDGRSHDGSNNNEE